MNITRKAIDKIYHNIDPILPPISIRKGNKKKALLSYIRSPFRSSKSIFHCNVIESIQIADALHEMGYDVDVVDYQYKGKINYKNYDIIFGFGMPFRNSYNENNTSLKRVCYLTGANPNFSNVAEAKRIKANSLRRGLLTKPRREVYWPWVYGAVNADALVITGNNWTASTYSEINDNIYTLPVPYISKSVQALNENVKRNFVWFSGAGAMFKGLDLAIEAIIQYDKHVELDVCGNIKKENDFLAIYNKELFDNERIRFQGMVNPNSFKMDNITENSSFVLFPSCSEGTASSVITCMAKGLIPVVTKESGINLEGFGILIESDTPYGVKRAIDNALLLSNEEVLRQRKMVLDYVKKNHSPACYKERFKAALSSILYNSKN